MQHQEHQEENCLFCKIAKGTIPAAILYRDEYVVAFRDIAPVLPQHVLIIPVRHIVSVGTLGPDDAVVAGQIMLAASTLARELGIAETGFRLVFNSGLAAGQTVFHLHAHLLGGQTMGWPPFPPVTR